MIVFWMLLGALLGAANGLTQRWSIARLREGERRQALLLTLGGMAIRLALVAGLLIVSLRHSVLAGFAAFGGLLLVRSVIVIWANARGGIWPSVTVGDDDHGAQDLGEDTHSDRRVS